MGQQEPLHLLIIRGLLALGNFSARFQHLLGRWEKKAMSVGGNAELRKTIKQTGAPD